MTLAEVIAAGLPAATHDVGEGGFTIDYLPGNKPAERFRVWGGSMPGMTFGPGGEHTPADGWRHEDGCGCELCRVAL